MFCNKCGKEIPDNSVFCPACGNRVLIETEKKDTENSNISFSDEKTTVVALENQRPKEKKKKSIIPIVFISALVIVVGIFIALNINKWRHAKSDQDSIASISEGDESTGTLEAAQSKGDSIDYSGEYKGIKVSDIGHIDSYSVKIYSSYEKDAPCGEIEFENNSKFDLYPGGMFLSNTNKADKQMHFTRYDTEYYMDLNSYTIVRENEKVNVRYIDLYFGEEKDLQKPVAQLLGKEYFEAFGGKPPILYACTWPSMGKVRMTNEPKSSLYNTSYEIVEISDATSFWGNDVKYSTPSYLANCKIGVNEGWIDLLDMPFSTFVFYKGANLESFEGRYSESEYADGVYNNDIIDLNIMIDDDIQEESFYGASFTKAGEVIINDKSYSLELVGNKMKLDGDIYSTVMTFSMGNYQCYLFFEEGRGSEKYATLYFVNKYSGLERITFLIKS